MHRYRYPLLNEFWRVARRVGLIVAGLLAVILAAELLRVWILLHRLNPIVGGLYAAAVAVGAIWLGFRLLAARDRLQSLYAPPLPMPEKAQHQELKRFCQHLVLRLKRMADLEELAPELRRQIRQRSYDVEGLLGAHPLKEDLERAISRAEVEIINPTLDLLDQQAVEMARYKMQAVVEDVLEPPFPVVNPLVVLYHQITLVSTIVDTYLSRPSLAEYWIVVRDVSRVMTGGEFFRIGQRLFEGVYANSPPMGRAANDLGQAITSIWLTWSVSQAALHRCRAIRTWTSDLAIAHLDERTMDSLVITRDTLIRDVLPVLKLRIRHSVGPGVADAAGFSEQVVQGIAKSVDTIVQAIRSQPAKAVPVPRRTHPGTSRADDPADPPAPSASSEGRRAVDWRRRGMFRVFRTFSERVHYSKNNPHRHD